MFIDELQLHFRAGKGGDGIVHWLHEKGKEFSGPDGGNGGKGGDIYVKAVRDVGLLTKYRHEKEFVAEDGERGRGRSQQGKGGEDLILSLPFGSFLTNLETGDTYELMDLDKPVLILKGGNGGLGNEHFKASTNVQPKESTPGKPGEEGDFSIELKLVADVGFVGFPNAGKSSLLNSLTRAQAKVGSYMFTTLEPNLGDMHGYILADIPGLIEGASEGKGLGHKFLRHVTRTRIILHCISSENPDVIDCYDAIRKELEEYGSGLSDKREVIVLTKSDAVTSDELEGKKNELRRRNPDVLDVTILDDANVKAFRDTLVKLLSSN